MTRATVNYLKPMDGTPSNYMYEPPAGEPWENCEYEARLVEIRDARSAGVAPSVHGCGFERVDFPSALRDFSDTRAIESRYYPEVAEIALAATGGRKAHVFDHLVRKREAGRPALTFGRRSARPGAVGRVHNDYSEASGWRRLQKVLQVEPERYASRFCIINVWRSIAGVVLDSPLALCDARSVAPGDLVRGEIKYPDRNGEIYLATYSPSHRWNYFPALAPEEALVFKQFDSQRGNVARFTPHAAFDHPDTPPDAPLRQSIEVRVLVEF